MAGPAEQDPKVRRTREAILTAARDLLEQAGPAAVTHQRVAAHAGVGRATVYRHWPDPEQLLRDAMALVRLPFFTDYQAGLHDWLRAQLRRLADELALPAVRKVGATAIHSAQWDPAARQQLDRWLDALSRRLHHALDAAAKAGEIEPRAVADPAETVALLVGPVLFRTLLQGQTVSDALLTDAIATVLPPAPQRRPGGGRRR
jgi:AcrR family transcriptional regulator